MLVHVVVFTEQTREENKIELYATNQETQIYGLIQELKAQVNTDEYILVEDNDDYVKFLDIFMENSVIIYYEELEVRE